MNEPKVRLATRADEKQLMDLCYALHEDNGLFSFNDDMVRGILEKCFNREGGIIGVIDGKNEIAAATYMMIANFWYSTDNHLEELFSFIRPNYRKSNYANCLLEFAKKCSKEIGLPLVIGIVTNKRMEAKVRLYHRKLGTPAGAFFVWNANWANEPIQCDELWRVHSRGRNGKVNSLPPSTMTTSALPLMALNGAA